MPVRKQTRHHRRRRLHHPQPGSDQPRLRLPPEHWPQNQPSRHRLHRGYRCPASELPTAHRQFHWRYWMRFLRPQGQSLHPGRPRPTQSIPSRLMPQLPRSPTLRRQSSTPRPTRFQNYQQHWPRRRLRRRRWLRPWPRQRPPQRPWPSAHHHRPGPAGRQHPAHHHRPGPAAHQCHRCLRKQLVRRRS